MILAAIAGVVNYIFLSSNVLSIALHITEWTLKNLNKNTVLTSTESINWTRKKPCKNHFKNMGKKRTQFRKSRKFFCSVIQGLRKARFSLRQFSRNSQRLNGIMFSPVYWTECGKQEQKHKCVPTLSTTVIAPFIMKLILAWRFVKIPYVAFRENLINAKSLILCNERLLTECNSGTT
jgi:hypothetical protein